MRQLHNLIAAVMCIYLSANVAAAAQNGVLMHATGSFEVKMAPESVPGKPSDPTLGQMSINKTFSGDLEGTSVGSMLSGGSPATGSAGYVAMEKVTGTLQGKKGSFILQHNATMTPSERMLNIIVVPGSGTDELTGISGKLNIRIENGKHFYDFDYTVP